LKSKPGVRVERRTLADGSVREYRYQRKRGPSKASAKTVRAAVAAWQDSPEWAILRPNTTASYTLYIHPLFQALGATDLKAVRRRHILAIRDGVAKNRGHGAAIAFCRATSALFKWALDHDLVESSPCNSLRRSLRHGTLPTWTEDQAGRAMHELPEPYRRAVVLAYATGQRRGDLCALRWSDYDGVAIRVRQQKTGERLEIPAIPMLRTELDDWRRAARSVTILETARGLPWIPGYLSRTLPAELTKIGLPAGLNIHGLRKLAAVRLAEAGCSAHEIASITGHRTLAMVQHYTRAANQRTLADVAVLRLDNQTKDAKRRNSPG
jgi:integrase